MHQEARHSPGFPLLHRMEGIQGEGFPVGYIFLYQKYQRRNNNGDDRDRRREPVASADLIDKFRIQNDREGTVSLSYQHRRTKVCEGSHEYQKGRGQKRRHNQRDHHFQKAAYARAAQVLGCLNQRIVDVLESSPRIQEYQRKQLKGHNQHNSPEAVNRRRGNSKLRKEFRNHTASSKQQYPGVCADKRS